MSESENISEAEPTEAEPTEEEPTEAEPTEAEPTEAESMFVQEDFTKRIDVLKKTIGNEFPKVDTKIFCAVMKQVYGSVSEEELKVLYTEIDANSEKILRPDQILIFLYDRKIASDKVDSKKPFPLPFFKLPKNQQRGVVSLLFDPVKAHSKRNSVNTKRKTRGLKKGRYLSITSYGVLTFWTERFEVARTVSLNTVEQTNPFSIIKKMCVTDMTYLKELKELAVSTADGKVLIYKCPKNPNWFEISHCLIVDCSVDILNYWSNGTSGVFSFCDTQGFLHVFFSNNIKVRGLVNVRMCKRTSLYPYPVIYVSSLSKQEHSFLYVKVHIFYDSCKQVKYISELTSFAICGSSGKEIVVCPLPTSRHTRVRHKSFKGDNNEKIFSCIGYFPSSGHLVTGGKDGLLRLWLPKKSAFCVHALPGHNAPITHLENNPMDGLFLSLSRDLIVCVWSTSWVCVQKLVVNGMEHAPIISSCYNIYNNEFVLANEDIVVCHGRGTDVLKNMLTTHEKPLFSALYNRTLKKVISVCHNDVVKVWNMLTGNALVQFEVRGITAINFDESERRILTGSQDGKVRLWNFNSATELAVLPVTLPCEVTGLINVKNRVFVTGMKSKTIFNLDLDGKDNRYWEHSVLDDIISMAVLENKLITASSNRNVVVWDTDDGETCYMLQDGNPKIYMTFKKDQGRNGVLTEKKTSYFRKHQEMKSSVTGKNINLEVNYLLLWLSARETTTTIATLLTSMDGDIYAWAVKSKGGLIGKFRAVIDDGAIITTMSTDESNKILLTGDNTGKISVWDIEKFGIRTKEEEEGPFETIDNWQVSLCPPPLLDSWQCCNGEVVKVLCDGTCDTIITAGFDLNVQLWTDTGCHVGIFGRDLWNAANLYPDRETDMMPVSEFLPSQQSSVESQDEAELLRQSIEDYSFIENNKILRYEEFIGTNPEVLQLRYKKYPQPHKSEGTEQKPIDTNETEKTKWKPTGAAPQKPAALNPERTPATWHQPPSLLKRPYTYYTTIRRHSLMQKKDCPVLQYEDSMDSSENK